MQTTGTATDILELTGKKLILPFSYHQLKFITEAIIRT